MPPRRARIGGARSGRALRREPHRHGRILRRTSIRSVGARPRNCRRMLPYFQLVHRRHRAPVRPSCQIFSRAKPEDRSGRRQSRSRRSRCYRTNDRCWSKNWGSANRTSIRWIGRAYKRRLSRMESDSTSYRVSPRSPFQLPPRPVTLDFTLEGTCLLWTYFSENRWRLRTSAPNRSVPSRGFRSSGWMR